MDKLKSIPLESIKDYNNPNLNPESYEDFRKLQYVPKDIATKTISELTGSRTDSRVPNKITGEIENNPVNRINKLLPQYTGEMNKPLAPDYVKIPDDIPAEKQPDSFLEFYNKYVPQPKENKETENSLRRLALAELIQKGIAGVGNVAYAKFGGKNKQWDSQPVSNTYLKSIEAADQRRKYFDSLNHDYKKGMFNVAVEDWKYKKGKEAKAADDEESKRRFDAEMGLKDKALGLKDAQEKAKVAARIQAAKLAQDKTVGKKLSPGSFVVARDPYGVEIKFGNERVLDVYNYALKNGLYSGKLEAELRTITDPAVKQQLIKNWVVEAIQRDDNVADYAAQHQSEWIKDLEATNKYSPNVAERTNSAPQNNDDPLGVKGDNFKKPASTSKDPMSLF